MSNLLRIRSFLIAAGVVAGSAACRKDEGAKPSDHAAEQVKENREDVREEMADVEQERREAIDEAREDYPDVDQVRGVDVRGKVADVPGSRIDDIEEEQADVDKNLAELADAEAVFAREKANRLLALAAVRQVLSPQPMLIHTLSQRIAIEQDDRADLDAKLQTFQTRLDEMANAIDNLKGVDAQDWKERNEDVSKAVERARDARDDAWEELHDADRDDRTSMLEDRRAMR